MRSEEPGEMRTIAFVRDLMDRSKIQGTLPDVLFASAVDDAEDADAIVVDLATHADLVAELRAKAPHARIVGYGAHVDVAALQRAVDDGADRALPRSQFFRDPAGAVAD